MVWQLIVCFFAAYLLGSVNLSIILGKLMGKGDIRKQGSGNAGTTNTLRVLGKLPAVAVLLFDVLKAVLAVYVGVFVSKIGHSEVIPMVNDLAVGLSAIGVILGHNFPIYYGFKGGKGIATSLGVLLVIDWRIGITCLLFALILMALSRMVSLGSIMAAVLFPILVLMQETTHGMFIDKGRFIIFAILIGALAIFRHRANIKRLMSGTENKLWKTKEEKLKELS